MFSYSFPAVKGIQAGKEYYIAMIPLSLLSKLFPDEDDVLPPEFRAQRRLNETRIPEIEKYILDNRKSYVFSALSASIDGHFSFESEKESPAGILKVDLSSRFMINDGQHRKAAITAALEEDPSLGDETISIVFFKDEGLKRSQQMFTDLNKHAVKTSNSLSTLYDSRDEIAMATKEVVNSVPVLKRFTDLERDILGKNSRHFFTLNSLKKANQKIIKTQFCSSEDMVFLVSYWSSVFENIGEWNDVVEKRMTKLEMRENYVLPWSVTINAFGKLGDFFYSNRDYSLDETLKGLSLIDWLRSATENWGDRIIRADGKIINTEAASTLACSKIKQHLGLPLSKEEKQKEQKLMDAREKRH